MSEQSECGSENRWFSIVRFIRLVICSVSDDFFVILFFLFFLLLNPKLKNELAHYQKSYITSIRNSFKDSPNRLQLFSFRGLV